MKKNLFWRIVSRVFHPMSMPLWCVVLYYLLTPQPFIPLEAIYTAIVVAVATVVIPFPVLLVLKVSGKIESLSLPQTYERRLPLLLVLLLLAAGDRIYLSGRVSPPVSLAMYGAVISLLLAYVSLFWDKVSLHAMGISALLVFTMVLMIRWEAPLSYALPVVAALWVVYDLVVMARLELGRHNVRQIILGTLFGALPQLVLLGWVW